MKMKPKMKVGNLAPDERDQVRWLGFVVDTAPNHSVATYWNKEFCHTIEYTRHLEVV